MNAAFVVATTTALVAFTLRETHIRILRFTLQMRCRFLAPLPDPQPLLTLADPCWPTPWSVLVRRFSVVGSGGGILSAARVLSLSQWPESSRTLCCCARAFCLKQADLICCDLTSSHRKQAHLICSDLTG